MRFEDTRNQHIPRASDPSTPSAELDLIHATRRYWSEYDAPLARALAGNPNASPALLAKLAHLAIREVVANPIFDLILMEDPGWVDRLDDEGLHALVGHPPTPKELLLPALRRLSQRHRSLRPLLQLDRPSPEEAGQYLLQAMVDPDLADWAPRVLLRAWTIPPDLSALVEPLLDEKLLRLPFWRRKGPLGPEQLAALVGHGQAGARLAAPYAALELRHLEPWLRFDPDGKGDPCEVRKIIARRRDLPASWLRILALRRADAEVAANPLTPLSLLGALVERALKRRTALAMGLVANPRTTDGMLLELALRGRTGVRKALAFRVPMPEAVMRILIRDRSACVRRTLVGTRSLPVDLLALQVEDPNPIVRRLAVRNRGLSQEQFERLSDDPDAEVRQATVRRRRITPRILERLAFDPFERIREEVARHPRTPVEVLIKMLKDPHDSVRQAVVNDDRIPVELLEPLLNDPSQYVRWSVGPRLEMEKRRRAWEESQKKQSDPEAATGEAQDEPLEGEGPGGRPDE